MWVPASHHSPGRPAGIHFREQPRHQALVHRGDVSRSGVLRRLGRQEGEALALQDRGYEAEGAYAYVRRPPPHFRAHRMPFFQVKVQAQEIYDKYFKAAQAQPRGVVAKLGNIVAQIERACQKQHMNYKDGGAWREILKVRDRNVGLELIAARIHRNFPVSVCARRVDPTAVGGRRHFGLRTAQFRLGSSPARIAVHITVGRGTEKQQDVQVAEAAR